jgi:hypothetical protein
MTQNIRASLIAVNILLLGALGVALTWPEEKRVEFSYPGERVPRSVENAGVAYEAIGDLPVDKDTRTQLSAASIISRTYRETGKMVASDPMLFTLIGGKDRTVIHDPRSCFRGAGWQIDNDRNEVLPGTSINVHTCVIRQPQENIAHDVIYLYTVDGAILNSVTQIRGEMVWNAFLGSSNRPTFFFRCSRLVNPASINKDGGISDEEHKKLQDFAATMWKTVGPDLLKMRSAN